MHTQMKLKTKQAGLTSVEYVVAGAALVVAIGLAIAAFSPKLVAHFTALLT